MRKERGVCYFVFMKNRPRGLGPALVLVMFGFRFPAPAVAVSPQADASKPAAVYREWIDLVSYIITPTEKDVFFRLTSDRERNSFINLFWNLRDPSKGTPQNEYKEEHLKRFQHANRYFIGSSRPGWKTDRGKYYILLGPPLNKVDVLTNGLRPVEIWEYMGDPDQGLPTMFRIVFYKRSEADDYRLYVPAVDGPYALLSNPEAQIDPADNAAILSKIQEIDSTVAEIALNLIPGNQSRMFSPSLQDQILLARIGDLPTLNINSSYATNFLSFKGFVETSATTNYVEMTSDVVILKDPRLPLNFVHLALQPGRLSVERLADGRYYFNFNLVVTLKKDDRFILQYDKDFPVYMTQAELDGLFSQGVIIADRFPVVEGEYKLMAILRNSVNDEIGFMERSIKIVEGNPALPRISDPLISYGQGAEQTDGYAPFRIMGRSVKIEPKQVFGLKDVITPYFLVERREAKGDLRIRIEVESLNPEKPFFKEYAVLLPSDDPYFFFPKTLDPLPTGDYALRGKIMGPDDTVLHVRQKIFQIAPHAEIPHAPVVSKIVKDKDASYYYVLLAKEYDEIGSASQADAAYRTALDRQPVPADAVKAYAAFLWKQGRYDDLLAAVEALESRPEEAFSYFSLKGRALYRKQEYHAAVENLLEANKRYDSDVDTLNALGLSMIRTGAKEEAVKVLTASLRLRAEQPEIREILLRLEKK